MHQDFLNVTLSSCCPTNKAKRWCQLNAEKQATRHTVSTSTRWHFAFGLCCHSNETQTRAPTANPPNSAQLQGAPYHSPTYMPVSSVVWYAAADRQSDTHRHVWPIHILHHLRLTQNVTRWSWVSQFTLSFLPPFAPEENLWGTGFLHARCPSCHPTNTVKPFKELQTEDVLSNSNRIQAAERAEKCRLLSLLPWPLTLTFKLVRARDQTRLPCEFGTNPFSSSQDISYTNKKSERQKQNCTQFTACGKNIQQNSMQCIYEKLTGLPDMMQSDVLKVTQNNQSVNLITHLQITQNDIYHKHIEPDVK